MLLQLRPFISRQEIKRDVYYIRDGGWGKVLAGMRYTHSDVCNRTPSHIALDLDPKSGLQFLARVTEKYRDVCLNHPIASSEISTIQQVDRSHSNCALAEKVSGSHTMS